MAITIPDSWSFETIRIRIYENQPSRKSNRRRLTHFCPAARIEATSRRRSVICDNSNPCPKIQTARGSVGQNSLDQPRLSVFGIWPACPNGDVGDTNQAIGDPGSGNPYQGPLGCRLALLSCQSKTKIRSHSARLWSSPELMVLVLVKALIPRKLSKSPRQLSTCEGRGWPH